MSARDIAPYSDKNASLLVDESCEDGDDIFKSIANRNKIKDADSEPIQAGTEEEVDFGQDMSTDMIELKDDSKSAGSPSVEDMFLDEPPPSIVESPKQKQSPKMKSPRVDDPPLDFDMFDSEPAFKSPRHHDTHSPKHDEHEEPEKFDPVKSYAEKMEREEMRKAEEDIERRELLMRFFEFEEAGIPCPKRFTMKSDLSEMRFEFAKLDGEFNRKKAIEFFRDGAKLITGLIEVGNKKFDPIGWKSEDFSDDLDLKFNEIDWALKELHKKYFRKGGKPSPELVVILAVASTGVATHKNNVAKEQKRKEKAAASQPQHPMAWHPMAYPPQNFAQQRPPTGPPPGYRPPGPGQYPHQAPPQQFHPPQPQPQQPSQQTQQQTRPTIISDHNSVPGTNPLNMPPPSIPNVMSHAPVAPAIPANLPPVVPILGFNPNAGQDQQPQEGRKTRTIPPPSSMDGIGEIGRIAGKLGNMGSSKPVSKKTSNYAELPDEDDFNIEDILNKDEEEKEDVVVTTKKGKKSRPIEPPKESSPGKVRYDNGKIIFE